MTEIVKRWVAQVVGVAAAVELTRVDAQGWMPVVVAALVLLAVNEILRPLATLLSLPLILLTGGLFLWVLNAVLFCLVGAVVPGFSVPSLWSAAWASLVSGVVSGIIRAVLGVRDGKTMVQMQVTERRDAPPTTPGGLRRIDRDNQGNVIDV